MELESNDYIRQGKICKKFQKKSSNDQKNIKKNIENNNSL